MPRLSVLNVALSTMLLLLTAQGQTTISLLAKSPSRPVDQQVIREVQRTLNRTPGITARNVTGNPAIRDIPDVFASDHIQQRQALGRQLNSDLIVLIDSYEQSGNHAVVLVVVEPSTGLRIHRSAHQWDAGNPAESLTEIVNEILFADGKAKEKMRAVFAVPPFESRDLSQAYSFMMDAYASWIEQLLLNQNGVVVVELKEAESLMQLARKQSGYPAPYMLNGSFRNAGIGPGRTITFELGAVRNGKVLGTKVEERVRVEDAGDTLYAMLYDLLSLSPEKAGRNPESLASRGDNILSRADALGRIGFWDHAIPLYHSLLLQDSHSEPATLGLLEAYSTLLARSIHKRKDNPYLVVEMSGKVVDLVATLPPDWDVTNKKRLRDALTKYRLYSHLSPFAGASPEQAELRLAEAEWEMANLAYGALTSPGLPYWKHESPQELILVIHDGAAAWRERNDDEAFALWTAALVAIEGHERAFGICLNQMRWNRPWRMKSLNSDNDSIALAARISNYLCCMDPKKDVEYHWREVQRIEGYDILNRDVANALHKALPDYLDELKFRNKDNKTIVAGAKELTVSNVTADILSAFPVAPSRAIHDWIHADGNEFLGTDRGVFEVAGFGSFRKMNDVGAQRLWWDGQLLWCFSKDSIRVLSRSGKAVATFQSDDLPFPIVSEYMFVVPLEPGWVCLVGAEKVDRIRRTWVVTLDARNADRDRSPLFNILYEGVEQKRNARTGNVAFLPRYAVPFGSTREHKIMTGGYYLTPKLIVDAGRGDTYLYRELRTDVGHMVVDENIAWATSSQYGKGQQNWTVWQWRANTQHAEEWYEQASYRFEYGASGRGMFRSVFIHDNQLHLIALPWHFPAWFCVDLSSKRVAVVADQLPEPISEYRNKFRYVSSSAYGLIGLNEGHAYAVSIPPVETLPTFEVPE